MHILVSAYDCAPGSVSWKWITSTAKLGHDVWAIVSPEHRDAIWAECEKDLGVRSIHFLHPEVPGWYLGRVKRPRWRLPYRLLWRISAAMCARELKTMVKFAAVYNLGSASAAPLNDRLPHRGLPAGKGAA